MIVKERISAEVVKIKGKNSRTEKRHPDQLRRNHDSMT